MSLSDIFALVVAGMFAVALAVTMLYFFTLARLARLISMETPSIWNELKKSARLPETPIQTAFRLVGRHILSEPVVALGDGSKVILRKCITLLACGSALWAATLVLALFV